MEIRYASHPQEVKNYDTDRLRQEFVMETLFVEDELTLYYSHVDRFITGGAYPVSTAVRLEADRKDMGSNYFLERRELGIINIGGRGYVKVDPPILACYRFINRISSILQRKPPLLSSLYP